MSCTATFKDGAMTNMVHKPTTKEKEVLKCLVDGLSYKMIADKLDITFHTTNGHIKKIYEKLHVNSATEAVSKALRNKLLISTGWVLGFIIGF